MSPKIILISLNVLIAIAIFLFALSASFIFSYILFGFETNSSEIMSTLVMLFVSGVIISLSVTLKTVFDTSTQLLPPYMQIGKYIGLLLALLIIARYFMYTL